MVALGGHEASKHPSQEINERVSTTSRLNQKPVMLTFGLTGIQAGVDQHQRAQGLDSRVMTARLMAAAVVATAAAAAPAQAGRRATRITVRVGQGPTRRLRGPRRTLKISIPYKRAARALLLIRARGSDGRMTTITQTVKNCRALS